MDPNSESMIDAEVQQINEVNLRTKKQCLNSDEEMTRERPMSWEGELSNDCNQTEDDDHHDEPMDSKELKPENNHLLLSTASRIESPMCTDINNKEDDNDMHQINKVHYSGSQMNQIESNAESKSNLSQFQTEIIPPIVKNQTKSSVRSSVIGYSGGIHQTPTSSPALITRPTSSSSSRSSYSPTASPLMARHIVNGVNVNNNFDRSNNNVTNNSHSNNNKQITNHCSSPSLSRQTIHENNTINERQSPSLLSSSYQLSSTNIIQNGIVTSSPSASPLPLRPVSTPITAVRNFFPISPNSIQSRSTTTTPDLSIQSQQHAVITSVETPVSGMRMSSLSSPPYHHLLASRDSGCVSAHDYHAATTDSSSRLSQVSPVTPHSLPELRSTTASSASVVSSASDESNTSDFASPSRRHSSDNCDDKYGLQTSSSSFTTDFSQSSSTSGHFVAIAGTAPATGPGLSRQQLLSGPCPICGDRISGFHYGIFSCESCKGFFKRTVQNKKNYVCLRGANCHVSIATRKKCPACRFDKCLKMGMKLEAIREDRTRGGRSTYQCSYTLSPQSLGETRLTEMVASVAPNHEVQPIFHNHESRMHAFKPKREPEVDRVLNACDKSPEPMVPQLIQDILSVEHLWHNADKDADNSARNGETQTELNVSQDSADIDLCNIADHRLYKIVKWCKSLPLFREIQMDDQIALLINSWCELLLLSCCYRSISTPNEVRLSSGKSVTLRQSRQLGLGTVIERMLNLTEHLRRLQFDQYEYCCLKVIILLTSDASGLKESEKVRSCQKQVLEALQTYTRTHYPSQPSKFGELLLRIPDLERTSQVGKESLVSKQKEGDMPSFNLLMELLRGDH